MLVKSYIPQDADGVYFFCRDEFMNDMCANGFGVPHEALEVGFREYADCHGASWYKAVWWSMWALLYRYKLKHIIYALSHYVVENGSKYW